MRRLKAEGFANLVTRSSSGLDLRDQASVESFFQGKRPEFVFLAAARVADIHANDLHSADFIRDNLQIQCNVIDCAYRHGEQAAVSRIELHLSAAGAQPMQESSLLSGPPELTNEAYVMPRGCQT